MKKLLVVGFLLIACLSFAQPPRFRFMDKEYFTVGVSIDPSSSFKEKGLDIVPEIEYVGPIYAKIGFESFSVLQGGYKDVHFGIGANFTSGYNHTFRYYIGTRHAIVFRDGGYAWNQGLEAGIDYNLTDNFFVGLRSTLDKRNEQKIIFGWEPETKFSGFVRLGYKWDYKPRFTVRTRNRRT